MARGILGELFCISGPRARAQHLRCKILNPGASAISPTSSKETEEEEEEEADGNGARIGVQDVRRGGREGVRC